MPTLKEIRKTKPYYPDRIDVGDGVCIIVECNRIQIKDYFGDDVYIYDKEIKHLIKKLKELIGD